MRTSDLIWIIHTMYMYDTCSITLSLSLSLSHLYSVIYKYIIGLELVIELINLRTIIIQDTGTRIKEEQSPPLVAIRKIKQFMTRVNPMNCIPFSITVNTTGR